MKQFLISLGLIAASGFYMIFASGGSGSIAPAAAPAIAQNTAAAPSSGAAGSAQSAGASAPPPANSGTQNASAGASAASAGGSGGASAQASTPTQPTGQYKNGTYTGSSVNVYYGNVQVDAVVSGGKLANVKILQYPNTHAASVYINQQAMPYLVQEALSAQSASVNIISGATFTSEGFQQSLAAALTKAKA